MAVIPTRFMSRTAKVSAPHHRILPAESARRESRGRRRLHRSQNIRFRLAPLRRKLPHRNRVVLAQKGTSPGERRDTEFVNHQWMHVGRLWTSGDPFLAVDATLRDAWQGFSNDQFSQVVELGPQDTSITVGTGRAAVVGADGVVRDDSWMEVFEVASGRVAGLARVS